MHLDKNAPSHLIREFILDTGLPLNIAPHALGITAKEFMSWWSDPENRSLREPQLHNICQHLGIDEASIIEGTYNKDLVRSRFFQGASTLPEEYSTNALSCVRTSAHIIKYILASRGQHFCDSLLQKLNVSPLIYKDLNSQINLKYFIDLLDTLGDCGFTDHELDVLAGVMFLSLDETDLGQKFKQATTYHDCFQVLAENTDAFDKNFIYTSELSKREFRLTAFYPKEHALSLAVSSSKLNRLFRYRRLLMGWFPYLSGLAPIRPKTICTENSNGSSTTYVMPFDADRPNLLSVK